MDDHPQMQATATSQLIPIEESARRQHRVFVLRRLLLLADGVALVAALALSLFLVGDGEAAPAQFAWGLATLPLWGLIFKLYGLYERDDKRVSHSTVDDIPWVLHAVGIGALGLWFAYKALPTETLDLSQSLTLVATANGAVLVARACVRALARRSGAPERVLLIGSSPMARLLVRKIAAHPEYRLRPIGQLQTDDESGGDPSTALPQLGHIDDLESVCLQHGVERLIVIAEVLDEEKRTDLIRKASALSVRVVVVPDLVDVLGPSVEVDDIEGITVLGLNPPRLGRSSRVLKRAMDLGISLAALIAAFPLLLLAAAAIKLTSRGSVLYSQERVGKGGRHFRVYKFRTMVEDAGERAKALEHLSAHPAWLLLERDPRITPVGDFLRTTSIDELPQLWNVIRGDMSLVGPRPMTPSVHRHISGWGERRLDLTPGITGLWQVLGRTTIPFEEMIKLDYLYVTNWSLWEDIRLLLRTLPVVLARRGAN